jgi:hypothetical protein
LKDEVWQVICQAMEQYKGVRPTEQDRQAVERLRLVEFDGGAFVISGCEVDLFVTADRRKRWATRRLLDQVLGGLVRDYGMARCAIHPDNSVSLGFAKRLGFVETERTNKIVRLEMKTWKSLVAF